jgi:hypothetical protein
VALAAPRDPAEVRAVEVLEARADPAADRVGDQAATAVLEGRVVQVRLEAAEDQADQVLVVRVRAPLPSFFIRPILLATGFSAISLTPPRECLVRRLRCRHRRIQGRPVLRQTAPAITFT